MRQVGAVILVVCGLASASAATTELERQQAELTQALETMQSRSDALTDEMSGLVKTISASAIVLSGATASGAEAEPGLYARLLDAQGALDALPVGDPLRAAQEKSCADLQKRIAQVSAELASANDRVKELKSAAQTMRREFAQLLERLEALSQALEKPAH